MKPTLRAIAAAAALFLAGLVHAVGGAEMRMEPYNGDIHDEASLQRGARLFVNYCLNCHAAQHMRYNRLQDIGLTEDQIRDNLVLTGVKTGERMITGLTKADAKVWFNGPVPDLTLEARVRGTQWIYNYMLGFYRDETHTGWNNLVFPNVSMPHPFWQLGGTQQLVVDEFTNYEDAQAALLQAKGMGVIEPPATRDGKYVVKTVAIETAGQIPPGEYRRAMTDLVNFLDYMAEPAKLKRGTIGLMTLIYLAIFFAVALWLKKEYWKDIR